MMRARSAASSRASSRGVPGTTLSPIASAPAATAASAPWRSVTPQILTNGRRATLAGSSGAAPARTNARAAAAGSAARTSASPTSAPSKPSARQRATVAASRTPDSAMTSRSSGTDARRREARSTSTSSVRRSRLLSPIRRAPDASAASSSLSSWTSTSGSRPISSARSTSSASRSASWSTASSSTMSAPAARSIGSWMSSTTKSLARTGMATAARTARRSSTDPPNQCGSHSTEMADAPPASYARARATMSSPSLAIRPADGDARLISAMRWRPGAASRSAIGLGRVDASAASTSDRRIGRRDLGPDVGPPPVRDVGRRRCGLPRRSCGRSRGFGGPSLGPQCLEKLGREPGVDGQRRALDPLLHLADDAPRRAVPHPR